MRREIKFQSKLKLTSLRKLPVNCAPFLLLDEQFRRIVSAAVPHLRDSLIPQGTMHLRTLNPRPGSPEGLRQCRNGWATALRLTRYVASLEEEKEELLRRVEPNDVTRDLEALQGVCGLMGWRVASQRILAVFWSVFLPPESAPLSEVVTTHMPQGHMAFYIMCNHTSSCVFIHPKIALIN